MLPVASHFPPLGDAATDFTQETCAGKIKIGISVAFSFEGSPSSKDKVPSSPYSNFSYEPTMTLIVLGKDEGVAGFLPFFSRMSEKEAFPFPLSSFGLGSSNPSVAFEVFGGLGSLILDGVSGSFDRGFLRADFKGFAVLEDE